MGGATASGSLKCTIFGRAPISGSLKLCNYICGSVVCCASLYISFSVGSYHVHKFKYERATASGRENDDVAPRLASSISA